MKESEAKKKVCPVLSTSVVVEGEPYAGPEVGTILTECIGSDCKLWRKFGIEVDLPQGTVSRGDCGLLR